MDRGNIVTLDTINKDKRIGAAVNSADAADVNGSGAARAVDNNAGDGCQIVVNGLIFRYRNDCIVAGRNGCRHIILEPEAVADIYNLRIPDDGCAAGGHEQQGGHGDAGSDCLFYDSHGS